MRILLVSRWFWEEHQRSGGGFLREQVEELVAAGVDLVILSQAADAGLEPEPRELGDLKIWVTSRETRKAGCSLADKLVKFWSSHRKAVTDATIVRQVLREHGPFDGVWAQTEEPDGLTCALAALCGHFPPLVTTVYALRYDLNESGFSFRNQSSLGFVFRHSDLVAANSEATADWMRKHYGAPPDRIRLRHPFLANKFLESLNRTQPVAPEKRVLFLGALNRKKGPDVFLRAALRLEKILPDWRYVMVGGETERDEKLKREMDELRQYPGLKDRMDWLGKIPADAVIREILRASVVVCPSRIEEFSRATIEALALGRPVILTETTGAVDWVRNTGAGQVVPPGDDSALALAIEHQIAEGCSVPAAVSEKAARELTAAKAAEELIGFFREVVGKI
jgi:glycosyltransferase involved in cell wall biosynthesis